MRATETKIKIKELVMTQTLKDREPVREHVQEDATTPPDVSSESAGGLPQREVEYSLADREDAQEAPTDASLGSAGGLPQGEVGYSLAEQMNKMDCYRWYESHHSLPLPYLPAVLRCKALDILCESRRWPRGNETRSQSCRCLLLTVTAGGTHVYHL